LARDRGFLPRAWFFPEPTSFPGAGSPEIPTNRPQSPHLPGGGGVTAENGKSSCYVAHALSVMGAGGTAKGDAWGAWIGTMPPAVGRGTSIAKEGQVGPWTRSGIFAAARPDPRGRDLKPAGHIGFDRNTRQRRPGGQAAPRRGGRRASDFRSPRVPIRLRDDFFQKGDPAGATRATGQDLRGGRLTPRPRADPKGRPIGTGGGGGRGGPLLRWALFRLELYCLAPRPPFFGARDQGTLTRLR